MQGRVLGAEAVGEIFGQWFRACGDIHLEVVDAKGRCKPTSPSQYTLRDGMIVRM